MGACLVFSVCMAITGLTYASQSIQLSDSPNGVTLLEQGDNGLTLKMEIGTVDFVNVFTKEGTFNVMTVSGFTRSHQIGEPALPMANELISIPYGCELNVNVVNSAVEEISLDDFDLIDLLMPAQPPLSKSDDPASVPFEFDQAVYEQTGYYSLPLTETKISGTMRGVRLGMVSIAPVQYNPTESKVRVYTEITVEISFDNPDWTTTEEIRAKYYSPFFEPVFKDIINYKGQLSVDHPDLIKYPVKYAIISDRMFEAQLQPFIEWKVKKGFNVITAYTDVIGSTSSAIKSYIEGLYNAGTPEDPAPSFVLLVGDAQQIPPFSGSTGSHITDLRFCEFSTPSDIFPEIYYGRFSAQNTTQLQPQIDKTLEYEQYLMPDPSYLDEVTLVAGVDASHAPTWGNGQINYGTTYYFNAAHGINPNVWLYPASAGSGAAADIIQTISDGVGLYNYSAHCGHTGHSNPPFTTSDIPGLTNYHMYLLGIGNCCLPNTFGTDYSTPCFGEAFLQVADKGGIGYIGGTNSTYWDEDYWWGVGYGAVTANPTYEGTGPGAYDGLFHDHGEPVDQHYIANDAIIFAANLAVTESGSSREDYYWEIYHLMGDPSVMSYMGVPLVNNVVHDATILMTATSITVQADPASYVGISVDGELQGAGYVDASGSVEIALVGFSEPCEADIIVTGQNRQPYTSTIQVITPSGPYVIYDYYTIDDAAGNGNGVVDAGESITLGLGLINVGPDDAYDVNVTTSTTDSYVTVTDSTEPYGTIVGNNGTGYVTDAIAFDVSGDAPDGQSITFDLEVTGTARETWYGSFQIQVHSPALSVSSISIDDAIGGDDNGILDPGETAEVVVYLSNTGSGQAFSTDAYLSENDVYIIVNDDYGYFGDIDSINGSADNSADVFELSADSECPLGYGVPMQLSISGGGGFETTLYFNITVGDRAVFFYDDFSYEQGWTGLGGSAEWEMGSPAGGGGDPSQDHSPTTDNFVLGNDLSSTGTYNSNISTTQWVMSPIIDCANMSGVILKYFHLLGVESSSYDHAYFEVYDGNSWVRLFENSSTMQETSWMEDEYDLSAVADSNPDFQIRFGLGSTDGSGQYSGWNIDDIELKGYGHIGVPDFELVTTELSDSLQPGDQAEKAVRMRNTGDGTLRVWFTSTDDWLEFSGEQQVIYPGDSLDLVVTISTEGLSGGDYTGLLDFTSNDNSNPAGSVPVFLHVYTPDIYIVETSIDESLESGDTSVYQMLVTNNGPGRLDYSVGCQMFQNKGTSRDPIAPASAQVEPVGHRPADSDKSDATEPFFPPVTTGFGGPDIWGHNWIDSDEPAGPAIDWIDISVLGTEVILLDDDNAGPIAIGFGFPLYDSVYSNLYIGSNGILTFDEGSNARLNSELPTTDLTSMIAMWWDDLDPRQGGHIYYYYDDVNQRFIVSFVEIKHYYSTTGTGLLTFQAVLNADGTIKLQYGVMDPGEYTLESSTIGIQNFAADDALQILYNAPYIHDNLAIDITAEHWLSVVPAGGSIDPFGNVEIAVNFDATELEDGEYSGLLVVTSNDPDTPSQSIPVSLSVASWICGDIDGDGSDPEIIDLIYLVNYMFNEGPAPPNMWTVNVDGEPGINIVDLMYLVDFMFHQGPALNCE